MRIFRGTVPAGVGAALVLLSACTGGSTNAASTSLSSTSTSAGGSSATATQANQPVVKAPVPDTAVANAQKAVRPSDVEVSIMTAIGADGTVEWFDAHFVHAVANNEMVEPTSDTMRTAKLAADAIFLSTQGCDPNHATDPAMDRNGLGTVPCDRKAYAKMTPQWTEYGPSIFFNDHGEIVKMANHYHP